MRKILFITMMLAASFAFGQDAATEDNKSKLSVGGYAQLDFNQALSKDLMKNAKLDVHRLVMLLGYKFTDKTQFVSEIEYEHVTELYMEQAYIRHRFNDYLNLKAGLILIPMGLINEFHEPPTYNGVERPNLDKYVIPSTWREIGAGFTGNIKEISIKYQLYVINGFKSYDGEAKLTGSSGLRKGRQKGAESFMSSPNLSTKIDFYGISGLKIGAAGYFGKTQSSLYNGINKSNDVAIASADSSVVGISMIGLDLRYEIKGLRLRGQYNLVNLSNTKQYNEQNAKDLGKTISGFYTEAAYNVLNNLNSKYELNPFVRFEKYNTHQAVDSESITKNKAYDRTEITFGLGWKLAQGAVLKIDYGMLKTAEDNAEWQNTLNLGVGVYF